MKKTYKNVKRTTTASGCNKNNRYKNNPYEKISFSHLGQQNLKNNKGRSPAQSKARDVIRKYKMQLRKLEFKRLKKLVPSMQNTSDEESNEVISNYFGWLKLICSIFEAKGKMSRISDRPISTFQVWRPNLFLNYILHTK